MCLLFRASTNSMTQQLPDLRVTTDIFYLFSMVTSFASVELMKTLNFLPPACTESISAFFGKDGFITIGQPFGP